MTVIILVMLAMGRTASMSSPRITCPWMSDTSHDLALTDLLWTFFQLASMARNTNEYTILYTNQTPHE
jgi:hypothetical protein